MPGGVQYLLVEVKAVYTDLVLFSLATRTHFARLQDSFRLDNVARRLHSDVLLGIPVKHSEKVVVTTSHDGGVIPVPTALELVKNAVVLVQRAQLMPQVLVNLCRE